MIAQNLSHDVCGVIIKCGTVRSMCRLNAIVEVNVVIGVLVVHCELLVVNWEGNSTSCLSVQETTWRSLQSLLGLYKLLAPPAEEIRQRLL